MSQYIPAAPWAGTEPSRRPLRRNNIISVVWAFASRQVLSQAGGLCAYCRSAEALLGVTFEIDHIVPLSTGGGTSADNLCLSCPTCNRQKGIRQTALDPLSGEETPLFHP